MSLTFDTTFLRWGLTMSTKKTKGLVVGRDAAAQNAEPVIMMRGNSWRWCLSSSISAAYLPLTAHWTPKSHTG